MEDVSLVLYFDKNPAPSKRRLFQTDPISTSTSSYLLRRDQICLSELSCSNDIYIITINNQIQNVH